MSQASLDAYISIAEALPEKRRRVFEVVVRYSRGDDQEAGATLNEIATALELGNQLHLISGRITELKKLGLIYETGHRRDGQSVHKVVADPPLFFRLTKPMRAAVLQAVVVSIDTVFPGGATQVCLRFPGPLVDGPLSEVGGTVRLEVN